MAATESKVRDTNLTVSSVTGNGPTYTAAQMFGGVIDRSGTALASSDTTATAAAIVAAIANAQVNNGFYFTVINRNTVSGLITVAAGTGVTLAGTTIVAINNSRQYLCTVTNATAGSEAVTIQGLLTAAI